MVNPLLLRIILLSCVLFPTLARADAPLAARGVNCNDLKYQNVRPTRNPTKRSRPLLAKIKKAVGTGKYPVFACTRLIAQLGASYCHSDADTSLLRKLTVATNLCDTLKANRKIVDVPVELLKGGATSLLGREMKAALRKKGIAQSDDQILAIAPIGAWQTRSWGQKQNFHSYRTINGTVLWRDDDNDEVCRFTTLVYFQDRSRQGYSQTRYWPPQQCKGAKSCAQGWTSCARTKVIEKPAAN